MSIINLTKDINGKSEYDFDFLKNIISECNMPLSIGGGIDEIKKLKNFLNLDVIK